MASLSDKETAHLDRKVAVVVKQDSGLTSQIAAVCATTGFYKKKRAKSRRFDLLQKQQQHHQQQQDIRNNIRKDFQSSDHLVHVYNAIKLTNYYTNLLFNKHKKQKCDKPKISGANWRTKQLAQQIPHQDIKLLAAANMSSMTTMANQATTIGKEQSTTGQSVDEVNFIRNQRKLASQFKASLYYLNPIQTPKVNATNNSSSWLRNTSSPSLLLGTKETGRAKNHHHQCFKCKLPIKLGSACVRVDNLQVDCSRQQQDMNEDENLLDERCQEKNRKSSQTTATTQSNAIHNKSDQERQSKNNNDINKESASLQVSNGETEEKSSCDEGLGTGSSGNSSAQSSSAGSHCDDRETPPHVVVGGGEPPTASSPSSNNNCINNNNLDRIDQPIHCSNSCDNLKLSSDSLDVNTNNSIGEKQSSKNKVEHRRNRSFTLSDDEAEKVLSASGAGKGQKQGKSSSRKIRALTWSASLTSFGASFKFGSKIGSKTTTTTSEAASHNQQAVERSNQQSEAIDNSNDDDDTNKQTILFHTDCFSCSTCNELLVDLRALIYVSEQPQIRKQIQQEKDFVINKHDSDYVNLTDDHDKETHDERLIDDKKLSQAHDGSRSNKQQISLYCHRHFVELFKPRCQQCDCLILDEECTEAEGKVWHIKHFCCTECKVPLGGQQYIIVDQTSQQAKNNHHHHQNLDHLDNSSQQQNNSPYCLKCFDRVFGETCEECGKLITCDLGAINHEQRCWHASGSCFKCRACSKSLLGSPFLPSSDGRIYCSIQCCELYKKSGQLKETVANKHNQQQQQLSLPNYCDPRAPQGALQHQLSLAADNKSVGLSSATQSQMEVALNNCPNFLSSNIGQQQQPHAHQPSTSAANAGLLRHKPLIDYLLANARSDEFSHQLLNCLFGQFSNQLANKQTSGVNTSRDRQQQQQTQHQHCGQINSEETKLLSQIGNTLEQIESERKSNQSLKAAGLESTNTTSNNAANLTSFNNNNLPDQLSARRNKLNPFLIDSNAGINNKRLVVAAANNDTNNNSNKQIVMSMLMDGSGEASGESASTALANYINLDLALSNLPFQLDQHKLKQQPVDSVDNGSHSIMQRLKPQQMQLQQQQQLKRNNSNSNKLFGVQNSNAFTNLTNSTITKASQCSPAVSLVSNEGTISDHSATSSGVSTAPPVSSTNGSLKSHSPLSSTSSHSSVSGASISSTGISSDHHHHAHQQQQQQLGKQPLRQHINSVSATLERRRRVQPITELSVLDLLSVADDQLLSKHHHPHQQQQQQQPVSDGFDQLVSHFKGRNNSLQKSTLPNGQPLRQPTTCFGDSTNKHQESFFFELAQRLPKNPRDSNIQVNPSPLPLDTNGLPTIESGDNNLKATSKPTTIAARTVTDHYSTVNKVSKLIAQNTEQQQQQQQQTKRPEQQMFSDDNVRESFFAITSPLLSCNATDQLEEVDPVNKSGSFKQNIRPTSSLSVLAPVDFRTEQRSNLLHPSFSTVSLNCPDSSSLIKANNIQRHGDNNSPLIVQPTTSACSINQEQQHQQQQQQKPATKVPKSVSFDPTVKDPECPSGGSMTIGRASALKSALKSSSLQRQHQDFMNCSQTSNTLPSSLANQIKSGSLNAYSAYYDEYGRRIKLSSLFQNSTTGFNEMPIVDGEIEEEAPKSKSGGKSIISGALSKLSLTGSQSSRGGRREERRMRQQQQQQLTVQTSQPLSQQELFAQSVEQVQVHQGILMQPAQCSIPSTSAGFIQPQPLEQLKPKRNRRRNSSSWSRNRKSSSSSSSNHRRRGPEKRGPRGSGSSRRNRRSHRKRSSSSRYCDDDNCYDSDNSSTCSTCSSSSSYTDCSSSNSEITDCSDNEVVDFDDGRSSSSSASKTSYTSYSSSDRSDCSDDDSYTSDTDSSHSSTSCSSYSSRSSSLMRDRDAGRRKSRRTSGRRRYSSSYHDEVIPSTKQHVSRSSSRRSSKSGSSRSSSSRSTSRRRRGNHGKRHTSSSSRNNRSRHSEGHPRRKEQQQQHQQVRTRSGRHAHSRSNSVSNLHVQPNLVVPQHQQQLLQQQQQLLQQQQPRTANMNFLIPPTNNLLHQQQVIGQQQQQQQPRRAKSPSTLSTDSKSTTNNENCRII